MTGCPCRHPPVKSGPLKRGLRRRNHDAGSLAAVLPEGVTRPGSHGNTARGRSTVTAREPAMPDYQKLNVDAVNNYKKLLAKAGPDVIPAGDKGKLIKALDAMLAGLKLAASGEKFTTENNALVAEMTKLADKFKKYNTDIKKYNSDLADAVKDCNVAKSLANQQKGFDKSKDFKDMADDMRDVADWLDLSKKSDMVFKDFAAAF
jgi:hypothetical protein